MAVISASTRIDAALTESTMASSGTNANAAKLIRKSVWLNASTVASMTKIWANVYRTIFPGCAANGGKGGANGFVTVGVNGCVGSGREGGSCGGVLGGVLGGVAGGRRGGGNNGGGRGRATGATGGVCGGDGGETGGGDGGGSVGGSSGGDSGGA